MHEQRNQPAGETPLASAFFTPAWYAFCLEVNRHQLIENDANEIKFLNFREAQRSYCFPLVISNRVTSSFIHSLDIFFFAQIVEHLKEVRPSLRGARKILDDLRTLSLINLVRLTRWLIEGPGRVNLSNTVFFNSPLNFAFPVNSIDSDLFVRALKASENIFSADYNAALVYMQDPSPEKIRILEQLGYHVVKLFPHYYLDLSSFACFEDYLMSFRSKDRNQIRRDMKLVGKANIQIFRTQSIEGLEDKILCLYNNMYLKYSRFHPRFKPAYFAGLSKVPGCEWFIAEKDGKVVGFNLAIRHETTLTSYKSGLDYKAVGKVPLYFSLIFYEPIRYALEHDVKEYHVGGGVSTAKQKRGFKPIDLYGAYRVQGNRFGKWLFREYVQIIEKEIDKRM